MTDAPLPDGFSLAVLDVLRDALTAAERGEVRQVVMGVVMKTGDVLVWSEGGCSPLEVMGVFRVIDHHAAASARKAYPGYPGAPA